MYRHRRTRSHSTSCSSWLSARREKPYGNLDDFLTTFMGSQVLFVPPCQSDPPPSPTNCYPSWSIGVPALTLLTHVHNTLLSGPHQYHFDLLFHSAPPERLHLATHFQRQGTPTPSSFCARVLMGPIAHTNPKPISILTIRAPTLSPLPHPSPTSLFRTCGNMIFPPISSPSLNPESASRSAEDDDNLNSLFPDYDRSSNWEGAPRHVFRRACLASSSRQLRPRLHTDRG